MSAEEKGKAHMRVEANTVVTLQYTVTSEAGQMVDDGQTPMIYLHGGEDLFPKLQAALEGRQLGDSATVTLAPTDGFGDYDAALVRVEPRSAFPENVDIGMQLEGVGDDGSIQLYSVTDVAEDKVTVDGNHPLAGMSLVFAMTVAALRPATPEENAAQAAQLS